MCRVYHRMRPKEVTKHLWTQSLATIFMSAEVSLLKCVFSPSTWTALPAGCVTAMCRQPINFSGGLVGLTHIPACLTPPATHRMLRRYRPTLLTGSDCKLSQPLSSRWCGPSEAQAPPTAAGQTSTPSSDTPVPAPCATMQHPLESGECCQRVLAY